MGRERRNYDYGRCHVCGAPLREQMIRQDFWLKGRLVVIEGGASRLNARASGTSVGESMPSSLVTKIVFNGDARR